MLGEPTLEGHEEAIRSLQAVTERLWDGLGKTATKEDVQRIEGKVDRVEGKIDHLAEKALDSAPSWAVREISRLRAIVGAVAGALGLALGNWVQRHFGGS